MHHSIVKKFIGYTTIAYNPIHEHTKQCGRLTISDRRPSGPFLVNGRDYWPSDILEVSICDTKLFKLLFIDRNGKFKL